MIKVFLKKIDLRISINIALKYVLIDYQTLLAIF